MFPQKQLPVGMLENLENLDLICCLLCLRRLCCNVAGRQDLGASSGLFICWQSLKLNLLHARLVWYINPQLEGPSRGSNLTLENSIWHSFCPSRV